MIHKKAQLIPKNIIVKMTLIDQIGSVAEIDHFCK